LYMLVYVISIMEAWKESTKGHNNLAKFNGSQASICRRFVHLYQHMALVGDMTIEELVLFYFQKRNSSGNSPYYEIEQD
jgi:ABC-type transporter Mla maintaining outer membrane lipid asymmetry ATPase subunit MlaF